MPKISKYREKRSDGKRKKAFRLHKAGWTLREIGKEIGFSYEWVRQAIKKLSTDKI